MDGYYYDAFISYRHLPREIAITEKLQKLLETYKSPYEGRYVHKRKRISRVFTDKTEMPLNPDIGDNLRNAIVQSGYFIIIASEQYYKSKWCMSELSFFLEVNNGDTSRLLFILADGEPETAITEMLQSVFNMTTAVSEQAGQQYLSNEPLFADIRAADERTAIKLLKKEFLRIAAPIIGCGYDDLYQRNKRRKHRNACLIATAVIACVTTGGIVVKMQQDRYKSLETEKQAESLISEIEVDISSRNMVSALYGIGDYYGRFKESESNKQLIEARLSDTWMKAAYCSAFSDIENVYSGADSMTFSSDSKSIITFELCENDTGRIRVYDLYLRELLSIAVPYYIDSNDSLNGLSNRYTADYDIETEILTYTANYKKRTFDKSGKMLSEQEAEAIPASEEYLQISKQTEYERTYNIGPVYITDSDVFYLAQIDEESNRTAESFDAFGEAKLISSGRVICSVEKPKELFNIAQLFVSPDMAYAIVVYTRGVYEVQMNVYDIAMGEKLCSIFANGLFENIWFDAYDDDKLVVVETESSICGFHIPEYNRVNDFEIYTAQGDINEIVIGENGIVYVCEYSGVISAVTLKNTSLVDALNEGQSNITDNLSIYQNDYIADSDIPFSNGFAEKSLSISQNLNIASQGENRLISEDAISGVSACVQITDNNSNIFVSFVCPKECVPYFSSEASAFGFADYSSEAFLECYRLYNLEQAGQILSE